MHVTQKWCLNTIPPVLRPVAQPVMQPAAAVVCVQGTQVRCAKRLNRSKYRLSWADSYWPKEPLLERVLISATWRMRWIGGSDVAYRYHYCSNFCSVYLLTNLSTGWAKNRYTKLMAIFCPNLNLFSKFFHWKIFCGILTNHFTANLPENLPVKEFFSKSTEI